MQDQLIPGFTVQRVPAILAGLPDTQWNSSSLSNMAFGRFTQVCIRSASRRTPTAAASF